MTSLRKNSGIAARTRTGCPVAANLQQGNGEFLTRLLPGETHTTDDPKETIVTILGSCIAACVRDPITGVGGMNHFMLPESETGLSNASPFSSATLYGNFAMEMLINSVLGMGCPRSRLEIKLFGGANFTQGPAMIGKKNSRFRSALPGQRGLAGRRRRSWRRVWPPHPLSPS